MFVLLLTEFLFKIPASEPITITYQLSERCKTLPEKGIVSLLCKGSLCTETITDSNRTGQTERKNKENVKGFEL